VADARGEDRGHRSVRFSGIGKKSREAIAERKWPDPEVEPEGRGGAVADENFRSEAKGGEARRDIFPNGSVEVMGIPQVPRRRPAILPPEPADPRGGGVRVHFGKEFGQERQVLGGDGENTETPFFFRDADIIPSDLALAAIAGFLPSPEESTSAFINCRDNIGREKTRSHGMGNHCGEDQVNENKSTANGEGPAPPSREVHITFGHDGGEI
jgi:hypothetical protein